MNRVLVSLAVAIALGSAAVVSVRADAKSDRAALQAELDALLGEINDSVERGTDRPFEGGEADLVLLSSAEVRGEYTPCG